MEMKCLVQSALPEVVLEPSISTESTDGFEIILFSFLR